MRKLLIAIVIIIPTIQASAQLQFNPQVGINMISYSNPPEEFDYTADVGLLLGCDLRVGDRVQFQPGLFYMSTKTKIDAKTTTVVIPDHTEGWIRAKAFGAIRLLDMGNFKLRIDGGISYDFLMTAEDEDGEDVKDELNSGSLDLNLGIGADFLMFTADLGYNLGITDAFKSDDVSPDSRYEGVYFTVGVIFGKKAESEFYTH